MSDTDKDTRSQIFAKLLMRDLFDNNERVYTDQSNGYWHDESREIIARRACELLEQVEQGVCSAQHRR
jgi:hypothetical protein